MATKQVTEPGIGEIHLYKRKGARSIRLSITAKGQVRVTMPHWVPYQAGLTFARGRKAWIIEHTSQRKQPLLHGQTIGKSHRLVFEKTPTAEKVATRVTASAIYVTMPASHASNDTAVQSSAEKASIRALRAQAEASLPGRLADLARHFDFDYRSVSIKQMTGRWGSCDSRRNIVLNLFLMQLPWELIDYVLLHELTHTRVMKHGPEFWSAMAEVLPDVQRRRASMRAYRPAVGSLS
jgi:predicted metal-dependent hydrolase